jgi:putative hydrolase of the HAD superfamily
VQAGLDTSKTDWNRIRAVTFDVGGTLIDPWPSVGHIYAQVAAENGFADPDPELLNRQFTAAWRAKGHFDYSRSSWSALVWQAFHGQTKPVREISFFAKLYERFTEPDVWRIHDDVRPSLDALLAKGIRLAAISNWDERLRPLLQSLGLDSYFECIVISSEVGSHKPARVIFEHAVLKLGCAAEAMLHVGDSMREDVEGGRAAGFQTVLLSRDKTPDFPLAIRSLADISTRLHGGAANYPPVAYKPR